MAFSLHNTSIPRASGQARGGGWVLEVNSSGEFVPKLWVEVDGGGVNYYTCEMSDGKRPGGDGAERNRLVLYVHVHAEYREGRAPAV
ncbi:rho guanine nucleotide exchange factor 12 [Anopheles sinensis]|uniref:Rho guanine nucleotide exchange factor 12 n=1 Tax=Anopheles sinensis TaxID=74873 RepID=A0A084VWK6_ANOSI|nr:rho guanine nucleotide exchange factor 12 [Anopheles sinensis]